MPGTEKRKIGGLLALVNVWLRWIVIMG